MKAAAQRTSFISRRAGPALTIGALLLSLGGCGTTPTRPSTASGTRVGTLDKTLPSTGAASATSPSANPSSSQAYLPPAVAAQAPNAVPKPEPRSQRGNPPQYTVLGKTYKVRASSAGFTQVGYASWYGKKFQGRLTSSGEPFDMYKMTAAHPTLPIPTYVKVTNLRNHKSCVVRINDRGPFHGNRIIDLSYAAAAKLGMIHHGTTKVRLQALHPALPRSPDTPPVLSADNNSAADAAHLQKVKQVAAAKHHRYLQVGVFLHRDNAAALRDRLEGLGISNLKLRNTQFEDKLAVRVLVGPFKATPTLKKTRARLALEGFASLPTAD